jgi:asparagine synthase (glutamine-hydrolysing)
MRNTIAARLGPARGAQGAVPVTDLQDVLTEGAGWHFVASPFHVLGTGKPRFLDAEIAATAARDGTGAAWLQLHRAHRTAAPRRVHGPFSVAIVDTRSETAWLAIDRFAIEPLCYVDTGPHFAFATRADAVPYADGDVDPQAVFDYLYFHVIPAPRTIFAGIARLLPGHCVSFERGRRTIEAWWQPRFEESHRTPMPALKEEFRNLLRTAVTHAADNDALGCYLSGGTDSSTVAGMLGQVTGRSARTYSIGFDAAGYDEMEYARLAARHFGTDHHEYYVTPKDLVDHIPHLAGSFDQPFGNSSALPAFCCARMARDDGVRTMLAGDGGDELFGGNTRYAKQRTFELYQRLPHAVRHGMLEPIARTPFMSRLPLARKAASYVDQARVPMPDRMQRYNLLQRIGIENMLEASFRDSVDAGAPMRQQQEIYARCDARSLVNRMLAFDWKYTLADSDLPKVVGSAAMAEMAVAFPLLDDELVDFSLRLAPDLKLRGRRLRYFFKEALRGFLPDAIITKQKHGFGLPFGPWVLQDGPLRELALDALTSLKGRGIVRPTFIDELIRKLLPAHPGYYGELVWVLMMLERWCGRAANYRLRA